MRITPSARAILALTVLAALASRASAQSHDEPQSAASADAKQAFALIKSLSGRWQGPFLDPATQKAVTMEASFRVTSRGNAVVHEMKGAGDADDATKNDHPVTMMYLDGANLVLTHYCDAGNRPRMAARLSPDGKQIDFDFLDVAGPTTHGHMQHVRITLVDSTHHAEEWTWATPNGKTMSARMDLHRIENVAANTAK